MGTERVVGIGLKRVYEEASPDDGLRVLVDRLWPRGVRKEDAAIDLWLKDAAPSAALRRSFCHDPALFDAFREQYLAELRTLDASVLEPILGAVRSGRAVTLIYAARDQTHNHARVLDQHLREIA